MLENEQSILSELNTSTATESMDQTTSSLKRVNEYSEDIVCFKEAKAALTDYPFQAIVTN